MPSHPSPPPAPGLARRAHGRQLVWLWALAAWALYSFYGCTRYRQFLSAGYDLGIFDQAVRQYAHGHWPWVPLKGDRYNLLGDHFHPIIALLAPLYWVWDDPRTLVLAQAALVAASIPVVHRFLRRHLPPRLAAAGAVAWALGWPVQRLVDFDFHEICFSLPLLALALDALNRRDDRSYLLASLPLLLVREDMGMVLAMLGVVRLVRRRGVVPGPREWGRWVGAVQLVVGVVAFFLVTGVLLPHFASNGQFAYWTYDSLGPDAPSSVKFIAQHPLRTAHIFFTPLVKTRTMLYLFAPLLFLPLASPLVLVTLPLLAQRFLSSRSHLWTTEFHYSAPIALVLLFAAVDGWERLTGRPGRPGGARLRRPRLRRRLLVALAWALALLPLVDAAWRGNNFPLERLFWSSWRTKPIMRSQQAVLQLVPAGTCVEADDRLADHLTRTNRVTLPTLTRTTSDFVVLDMSQKEVGYPLPSPQQVERTVVQRGYRRVGERGPIVVWQRPGYAGPTPDCRPTAP